MTFSHCTGCGVPCAQQPFCYYKATCGDFFLLLSIGTYIQDFQVIGYASMSVRYTSDFYICIKLSVQVRLKAREMLSIAV